MAEARALLGAYAPQNDADVEALITMLEGVAEVVLDSETERAKTDPDKGKRPAREAV